MAKVTQKGKKGPHRPSHLCCCTKATPSPRATPQPTGHQKYLSQPLGSALPRTITATRV